ncbi:Endonuclease/exonuclease/phosphatase [Phytophthora cactorum]|nr:Endonuclease/exonuclease/phosphatase [Phytophthora cactorum]
MDLNTATPRELQQLPGVGCVIARLIIESRPFSSVEDLLRVKGIGPVKFAAITAENQVYMDEKPETEANAKLNANSTKIDLNAASRRQLQQLKGVGPVLAQRIVDARPFHRKEDLLAVNGIGTKSYVKIQAGAHVREVLTPYKGKRLETITEVRDLIVLKRLKTMLPGWDYVVSEPVGRKSPGTKKRVERYAFFYRRRAVQLVEKCWLLEGSSDVFTRLPCVASFRASKKSGLPDLELALMTESRHAEIAEINRLASELTASVPNNRKVAVLGDFNLSPQDVLGTLGSHKMALIRSPLSTTVFGKMYDNIWLDRADFSTSNDHERKYFVDSGVLRVDWRYYPPSKSSRLSAQNPMDTMLPRLQTYMSRVQCGYELSDHCPVWVAFAAASKRNGKSNSERTELDSSLKSVRVQRSRLESSWRCCGVLTDRFTTSGSSFSVANEDAFRTEKNIHM